MSTGDEPETPEAAEATPPPGYPYRRPQDAPRYPGISEGIGYTAADPPPPGASRTPLVVGIIAGIAVVVLIAALAVWWNREVVVPEPTPSGPTAADAVQAYLEALADGDADGALAWARSVPQNASLLTDEVLASSLARAPITDVEVLASAGSTTYQQVNARFKLGEQQVEASYDVVESGDRWLLDTVSSPVLLGELGSGDVPLTVNGVAVEGDQPELFPGSYSLGSADERYRVARGDFDITTPGHSPDLFSARLLLSGKGERTVERAAKKKLADCLQRASLTPRGCGFGAKVPKGTEFEPSGITWRVVSGQEQLDDLDLTLSEPRTAWAGVKIRVAGDFTSVDGSTWAAESTIELVTAKLSTDDVKVTFGQT